MTHTDLEDCDECDEKQAKIRELEAELLKNESVSTLRLEADSWMILAEKADLRIRELEAELRLANSKIQTMLELPPELQYKARAEKAEARVAELEEELKITTEERDLAKSEWQLAREREAE